MSYTKLEHKKCLFSAFELAIVYKRRFIPNALISINSLFELYFGIYMCRLQCIKAFVSGILCTF